MSTLSTRSPSMRQLSKTKPVSSQSHASSPPSHSKSLSIPDTVHAGSLPLVVDFSLETFPHNAPLPSSTSDSAPSSDDTKCFATQGFRKVDPDLWEFANEGFLGGQKHLLKTIKRRRNVLHSIQPQGGGACIELGQYGMEKELQRLRRDRNVLMAEIVKIRQQQQNSRDQIIAMEDRVRSTERKQHQIMSFLAKVFSNTSFIQQYMEKYVYKRAQECIDIGRKRRLTLCPRTENLEEEVVSVAMGSGQVLNYESQEQEELTNIESDMGTLFSAAMDNESSSDMKDLEVASFPTSATNFDYVNETTWEELFPEDLIADNEMEEVLVVDQPEIDTEVEELVVKSPDWAEDFLDLVD
ncbi:hypothetical protein F0562_006987 [Nyssa sinensis]|uniref:HSF-type DNA-binding domain-containing protein n=1 Tax=Nyssa sinensis TaxID=561372 RepID=A0A5J5A477_9ASTE|nr:hypothetical protein F0562_006987 [Nyssa sinensis]